MSTGTRLPSGCPVCGRPVPADAASARLAPFCSRRCADVDLGRWFTGHYRVPVTDDENADREVDPSEGTG